MSSLKPQIPRRPVCFVLDNVRSAQNVGAAFRIGDAFWISHIYCCGITPYPPHHKIRKTALGAEDTVPFTYVDTTKNLLAELKKKGVELIAVEQTDDAISLQKSKKIDSKSPLTAFVFGHEVFGIEKEILDMVDMSLVIPQHGTKKSLNVATCIGIVAWESLRDFS